MKNKLVFLVICSIIILSSCLIFYEKSSEKENEFSNINEIINSIENEETKKILADLYNSPAFTEKGNNVKDSTSNTYYFEAFKKMSNLTGENLDIEISKVIEKTITDNINNPDITWSQTFINTYVKKYHPEYIDDLEKQGKRM